MNSELFTVSRIFTECLYRIPDYQRGYSWGDEQLKDFWLDLEQLEENGKHYTGVLTLEQVPTEKWQQWEHDRWIIKSRRYKPYYVVDGQQRLTTIVILLQAILETTKKTELNFTPILDIRRKYVFDSKAEQNARSYIFGYEKDNPSYEFLIRRVFCEPSVEHSADEETIYTKNLLAAKEFFVTAVKSMSATALETLFTKVTQQLVFNVYEIASDIDVFVAFETMNNRGKPLSTLELLKNRLIYLSTKLPAGEDDGNVLRSTINSAWKTAYHYLGKNEKRPLTDDVFLKTHLSVYYATLSSPPASSTADDDLDKYFSIYSRTLEDYNRYLLNEVFTPKRVRSSSTSALPSLSRAFIHEYSQSLKSTVELFYKLSTPADSSFTSDEKVRIERIGRIAGYSPPNVLLALYTREKNAQKRTAFLEQFERFLFCQSLVARSPMYYARGFRWHVDPKVFLSFMGGRISTQEITTSLENTVTELFKETTLAEALNEWVKNGPSYYGWRSIKYFLFEYELSLMQNNKGGREKISWADFSKENYKQDFDTIEHVYPQRAKDKYWLDRFKPFTTTQKRLLRNSLGNLLPLARPRNSSLSNKSFPEKVGDQTNMVGYRYGSYSEIEVSQYPEWGAQQIVDRGVTLPLLSALHRLPIMRTSCLAAGPRSSVAQTSSG